MAPPACERGSQEVETSMPGGPKKEAPEGQISPPGGQISPPGGLPEASWASWAPGRPEEGALGGEGGVGKLHGVLLGPVFRPSWRILGPFWVDLPPRGEGPGRVPEGIFEGCLGTSRPRGKNCAFFEYLIVFSALFLSNLLSSGAFLGAWPAPPRICKNLEKRQFLWVASHMCLCLAPPKASKFQRAHV